mgnify:CR=1 FL=1
MAFQMFDRAKEVGYGKFTDIAVEFKSLLDFIANLDKDVIVYLLVDFPLPELPSTSTANPIS